MMVGKEQMLKIWQAVVVAVICFSGGAVIMLAEELWHIIYRKDSEEIPKWSDMNGIKAGGGAIIAAGVILFFIFLFF